MRVALHRLHVVLVLSSDNVKYSHTGDRLDMLEAMINLWWASQLKLKIAGCACAGIPGMFPGVDFKGTATRARLLVGKLPFHNQTHLSHSCHGPISLAKNKFNRKFTGDHVAIFLTCHDTTCDILIFVNCNDYWVWIWYTRQNFCWS